jgi:hypothetical protein
VLLLSLQELLALPKADANSRAATLLERWHFPNTYTLVRLFSLAAAAAAAGCFSSTSLCHLLCHGLNIAAGSMVTAALCRAMLAGRNLYC